MQSVIKKFEPISLAELNSKAELMDRKDNKYILSSDELKEFLYSIIDEFYILEIDGKREFDYVSNYLDTDGFKTHRDHNQNRRRRYKIRYRSYAQTDKHFFEVKLKGFRNSTQKYRVNLTKDEITTSPNESLKRFFLSTLNSHYTDLSLPELKQSIRVDYRRFTLVSKEQEERITIDNNITYCDDQNIIALDPHRWIIEVKSPDLSTPSDAKLRSMGLRSVSLCSKYCIGINLLKYPKVNNRFSPIIRKYFQNFHTKVA